MGLGHRGSDQGQRLTPPLAAARFVIIEPFAPLREAQQKRLAGRPVDWAESPAALSNFTGVHFSNELFDALPVGLLADR
jgi:SAM-dependent MidA family methyltransferase